MAVEMDGDGGMTGPFGPMSGGTQFPMAIKAKENGTWLSPAYTPDPVVLSLVLQVIIAGSTALPLMLAIASSSHTLPLLFCCVHT